MVVIGFKTHPAGIDQSIGLVDLYENYFLEFHRGGSSPPLATALVLAEAKSYLLVVLVLLW